MISSLKVFFGAKYLRMAQRGSQTGKRGGADYGEDVGAADYRCGVCNLHSKLLFETVEWNLHYGS